MSHQSPRSWVLPSSSEEPRGGFQDLATKLHILKQYHHALLQLLFKTLPQPGSKTLVKFQLVFSISLFVYSTAVC